MRLVITSDTHGRHDLIADAEGALLHLSWGRHHIGVASTPSYNQLDDPVGLTIGNQAFFRRGPVPMAPILTPQMHLRMTVARSQPSLCKSDSGFSGAVLIGILAIKIYADRGGRFSELRCL